MSPLTYCYLTAILLLEPAMSLFTRWTQTLAVTGDAVCVCRLAAKSTLQIFARVRVRSFFVVTVSHACTVVYTVFFGKNNPTHSRYIRSTCYALLYSGFTAVFMLGAYKPDVASSCVTKKAGRSVTAYAPSPAVARVLAVTLYLL